MLSTYINRKQNRCIINNGFVDSSCRSFDDGWNWNNGLKFRKYEGSLKNASLYYILTIHSAIISSVMSKINSYLCKLSIKINEQCHVEVWHALWFVMIISELNKSQITTYTYENSPYSSMFLVLAWPWTGISSINVHVWGVWAAQHSEEDNNQH